VGPEDFSNFKVDISVAPDADVPQTIKRISDLLRPEIVIPEYSI